MLSTNSEVLGETRVELSPGCGLVGRKTRLTKPCDEKFDVREVHTFLGIPYAKPPVGELMFRDPVPVDPWQGDKDATQFGPACTQSLAIVDLLPWKCDPPARMSEDCLHLDIWTPNTSRDAKLPVMVWFYGGGFFSGFTEIYRGDVVTNFHDVVIVTVSYRVGVWGFLCTGDSAATGNYGLLDQIESLKWINKHIENFGGDPNNVTLFGQSAGGISIGYHMVSPLSKGLFKNAISQSGAMVTMGEPRTAESIDSLKIYLKIIGCESTKGEEIISFLRSQPSEKLIVPLESMKDVFFVPVIDGRVITGNSSELLTANHLPKINHLMGVTRDEGAFSIFAIGQMMNKDVGTLDKDSAKVLLQAGLAARFASVTGKLVDAMYDIYAGDTEPGDKLNKALIEIIGDTMFTAPVLQTADAQSDISKVYLYSFEKRSAFVKYPEYVNADHGSDIPSVFGLPFLYPHLEFSAEDRALSRKIMAYWTNFAKSGNPNGSGLEEWPEYNKIERKYIVLDDPIIQSSDLKGEKIRALTAAIAKFSS